MKLKIQDGGYQFSASRKKKMVKKGTRFKMIVRAHTHTDDDTRTHTQKGNLFLIFHNFWKNSLLTILFQHYFHKQEGRQ